MNLKIYRYCVFVMLLLIAVAMSGCTNTRNQEDDATPLILGLDHVPLAVLELENAAETYRKLGFTLKPGREHDNSIMNQHIKFSDGTEIELITALDALDPLATEYLGFLASGDGAAFVGFYAPDMEKLVNRFDADGRIYQYDERLLTFPESNELRYIFFGQRNFSTTDQPEHFEHLNGAQALIGVWIASDNLRSEYELFNALGAKIIEDEVQLPDSVTATVVKLPQADVYMLPGSQQLVLGRKIIGVTVRTRSLDTLRSVLTANSLNVPPVFETENGHSMFVPPSIAHGIWLEFRQDDG